MRDNSRDFHKPFEKPKGNDYIHEMQAYSEDISVKRMLRDIEKLTQRMENPETLEERISRLFSEKGGMKNDGCK